MVIVVDKPAVLLRVSDYRVIAVEFRTLCRKRLLTDCALQVGEWEGRRKSVDEPALVAAGRRAIATSTV